MDMQTEQLIAPVLSRGEGLLNINILDQLLLIARKGSQSPSFKSLQQKAQL